jgi:hypothetical protein
LRDARFGPHLVDAIADALEPALGAAGVGRERFVHRGERNRTGECALNLGVDITHPHPSTGPFEDRSDCVENGPLPAADGLTGGDAGLRALAEILTKPHKLRKLNLESRVQECSA